MSTDVGVFDSYECVYEALLGRSINEVERDAVAARYGDGFSRGQLISLIREVCASDEFFSRHREQFAGRLFPTPCVVAARTPLGDEILTDLRQFHLGFAMATGHFEPMETAFIRREIKPGARILDIGANIGYFTTMLARLTGSGGSVISFEPVGETFRKLSSAIRRNGLDGIVTAHNFALGPSDGTITIEFERHALNIGAAHLATDDSPQEAHLCREVVPLRTLDTVNGTLPVDFVKIDVEGAEWMVVQGGLSIFRDQTPTVLMEFNRDQLEAVSGISAAALLSNMMDLGFVPYELSHGGETLPMSSPHDNLHRGLTETGIANLVLRKG